MKSEYLDLMKKVDVKKAAFYIGVFLLLVILALAVRRMIRKVKAESKDDDYLDLVSENIVTANLSYSEVDYATMADALEQHFSDTGVSGGMFGVNQKGIYEIMGRMKTNDDVHKLIEVFGTRDFKDVSMTGAMFSFLVKERTCTLPEAITYMLTNGERRKVNDILEKNGLTYKFN